MSLKKPFKVPFYIHTIDIPDEKEKLMEDLGIAKERKPEIKIGMLKTRKVDCYWIDERINDETGTPLILFYVSGAEFSSPYTPENIALLDNILLKCQE